MAQRGEGEAGYLFAFLSGVLLFILIARWDKILALVDRLLEGCP